MTIFLSQQGIEENCAFTRKNSYARKIERELHNEQFPLYIERCYVLHQKYVGGNIRAFREFWKSAITTRQLFNHSFKSKYKKMLEYSLTEKMKNQGKREYKDFIYFHEIFCTHLVTTYTKLRLLKAIEAFKPPEIKATDSKEYSFQIFCRKFFPGCQISDKKDDETHVPVKLAKSYYNSYLKSGLSFKEFDTAMEIS